ncbi:hypothetical protein RvY_01352 [Ramazzottius varieornatus]|uniref:Small ribosomal subunit protein uS15m n=1 Tax=Ramazzottius varieornatus TaxID=947166 RepID=A0A1D1UGX7_RAMVA|nr:hypothetical protein RvY_01352 [Ramazzottius varieornatus]
MTPCSHLLSKLLSLPPKTVGSPAFAPASRAFHVSSLRTAEIKKLNFRPELSVITTDVFPRWDNRASGDRDTYGKIDKTRLRPGYDKCEEQIKNAHPDVRKLCSLEYAINKETKDTYKKDLLAKVQRFTSDDDSIEARIAKITAQVRFGQPHVVNFPVGTRDGRGRCILNETINRRRKYLKRLREWDYNKFCWVLETLKLDFPSNQAVRKTTRKEVAEILSVNQAMEIRRDKLKTYHEALKAKQTEFLARKESELQAVTDEERQIQEELEMLKSQEGQYEEKTVRLAMSS